MIIEKQILTIQDIQILLGGVSYGTAARIMREVKQISDIHRIKGRIDERDWQAYIEKRGANAKN